MGWKTGFGSPKSLQFSLARTTHLCILLMLFLVVLTIRFSTPLLNGIVEKARQTSEEQLPQITRWRHNSERAELLHSYINTLYWVEEPQVSRSTRLQAQVLVHGFAFESAPSLEKRANRVIALILAQNDLRRQQRTIQQKLGTLSHRALELQRGVEPLLSRDHPIENRLIGYSHEVALLAIATGTTSIHNSDWSALQQQASDLEKALKNLAQDTHTHKAVIEEYCKILVQQVDSLQHMQKLIDNSKRVHKRALDAQQALSGVLNSDATLKTKQLAERVEADASQVRRYTLALLCIFVLLGTALLIGFNFLVLRPILRATRALEQVSHGEPPPKQSGIALFSELNTIADSVQRYGELTLQLHNTNNELRQLSQIDGLTELGNRRLFDNALQSEYDRACRHGHSLCLILFDLDHFKQINDRHGHLFGDDCLRAFAQLLKLYSQRSGDVAARYGGEEFVLILPEINLDSAQEIAERIRVGCGDIELRNEQGEIAKLSVSAGLIHLQNARLCPPEAMLREVDSALYRAKQQGRNRVVTVTNAPGVKLFDHR